jgi:hypothetical protein
MPSVHPGSGMIAAPVPEAVNLSVDEIAIIPPPFSPSEISVVGQEAAEEVIQFRCDPMEMSVEKASAATSPLETNASLIIDDNEEIEIQCTMAGSVRSLMVKPCDSIGSLKIQLANSLQCAATEIHIIFKGRIISNDAKCLLRSFGVKSGSKLQILKRPISRAWFQLKVHFPMSGQNPLSFRMHSSSTTLNVKKQLQELIGCPHNDICVFLPDGLSMNDDVSLRDYNVHDLEDIYCIINPSSTPQDVVIPLGDKAPFLSIKLSAEKLMEQIVRNQALRDRASKSSESKKLKAVDANIDNTNLRRVAGKFGSDDSVDLNNSVPSSKRRETFLGMRKGFLFAGTGKSRSKAKLTSSATPAATPEHPSLPIDPLTMTAEDSECERPRNSASTAAVERARKAGIPENLRTGRVNTMGSADEALAQLQKLLKDVLTPSDSGSESTVTAVAKESAVNCSQESEVPKQMLQAEQAPKRSGRCATCRAKVGLTAITCRCGGTFCARHRYAEAHVCQFDYKTFQRSRSIIRPVHDIF